MASQTVEGVDRARLGDLRGCGTSKHCIDEVVSLRGYCVCEEPAALHVQRPEQRHA